MFGIAYAPSTSYFAAGQASVSFNKPSPTGGPSVLPIKYVFRQRGQINFIREKTPEAVSSQVVNPLIVCISQFPCPFVLKYDFSADIIFFVPGAITRLTIWLVMVYSYCVYIGIVKNKDWPHHWAFVGVAHIISDAAYIDTLFHIRGFQRPF